MMFQVVSQKGEHYAGLSVFEYGCYCPDYPSDYQSDSFPRKQHKRQNITIIAMTANAFAEDRKNALDAGINDHLAKPIDIPKLLATLSRLKKQ